MDQLFTTRVNDGLLQAYSVPMMGRNAFIGGPVLDGVDGMERLRFKNYSQEIYRIRENESYSEHLAGTAAYAGPMIDHFGHFVTSCIHRIVPSRALQKSEKFLFISMVDDKRREKLSDCPKHVQQVLDYLDVKEENYVNIFSNTRVDDLVISEQGASIGRASHPHYLDLMQDFSKRQLKNRHDETIPSDRVFVAGRAGPGGTILGSAFVEQYLERAGYWIFRPERHPFSFQAYVYSKAHTIIFVEGSAIHGTSVLGTNMMADVHVLVRRPSSAGNFRSELVGRCRNLSMSFCSTFLGTLIFDKASGEALHHFGVSIYNPEALKQTLIPLGAASFFGFDSKKYYEHCESELLQYISWSITEQKSTVSTSQIADICNRLELAKKSTIN